jgi:hypothetical protein
MDPDTLQRGREQIDEWVSLGISAKRVEEWTRLGLMTRELILEREYHEINGGMKPIPDMGLLRQIFSMYCSPDKETKEEYLTEDSFCSLLEYSLPNPTFPPLLKAGRVIFTSMVYLAYVPFGPPPKGGNLTFEGLVRALIWSSPERDKIFRGGAMSTRRIHSRARTDADNRRLLFQSLATTREGHRVPFNIEESRKRSAERAFEFEEWERDYLGTYALANNDTDGDEIYHDIIDVLYITQPFKRPGFGRITRDVYRPLAKTLHTQDPLHLMTIPSQSFEALVTLLLGLYFDDFDDPSTSFCTDMSDLNSAAACIVKAFVPKGDSDIGVTWEMFNFALTKVTV